MNQDFFSQNIVNQHAEAKKHASQTRVMITPKVLAGSSDKKTVTEMARRVIAEHREVLIALKDR